MKTHADKEPGVLDAQTVIFLILTILLALATIAPCVA